MIIMSEKAQGITNTQLKLRDAATQMKLAIEHSRYEEIFRSCINSYISLARSVTMVMGKESSEYPELKSWYKKQTSSLGNLPIMKFFNAQRVQTIHLGVVKPDSHSMPISNLKVNGVKVSKSGTGIASVWKFPDAKTYIPGDTGNVFRLCEEYFLILKKLVYDWLQQKALIESKLPLGR